MQPMLMFFPVHAEYGNSPLIRLLYTLNHLDQGSFASAIRPKQRHEFTLIDGEAEVINGSNILKSLGNFRDLYRGCFRHLRFNIVRGDKGIKTCLCPGQMPTHNSNKNRINRAWRHKMAVTILLFGVLNVITIQ